MQPISSTFTTTQLATIMVGTFLIGLLTFLFRKVIFPSPRRSEPPSPLTFTDPPYCDEPTPSPPPTNWRNPFLPNWSGSYTWPSSLFASTDDVSLHVAPADLITCVVCRQTREDCFCVCFICSASTFDCYCPKCPGCNFALRRTYPEPQRCACEGQILCWNTGRTFDQCDCATHIYDDPCEICERDLEDCTCWKSDFAWDRLSGTHKVRRCEAIRRKKIRKAALIKEFERYQHDVMTGKRRIGVSWGTSNQYSGWISDDD